MAVLPTITLRLVSQCSKGQTFQFRLMSQCSKSQTTSIRLVGQCLKHQANNNGNGKMFDFLIAQIAKLPIRPVAIYALGAVLVFSAEHSNMPKWTQHNKLHHLQISGNFRQRP